MPTARPVQDPTAARAPTKAVFRVMKREWGKGDRIMALLAPLDPSGECVAFTHAEGLGKEYYSAVMMHSRPAKPMDYEALKRELESPPHNHQLQVMTRLPIPDGAAR